MTSGDNIIEFPGTNYPGWKSFVTELRDNLLKRGCTDTEAIDYAIERTKKVYISKWKDFEASTVIPRELADKADKVRAVVLDHAGQIESHYVTYSTRLLGAILEREFELYQYKKNAGDI